MAAKWLGVFVADGHTGCYSGLGHPDGFPLPRGGKASLTPGQMWLWATFDDFVKEAQRAAIGRRVCLVHGGDTVHGTCHDTQEIVTPDMTYQIDAAYEVYAPLAGMADDIIWCEGTEAHDGKNGQHAEAFAKRLAEKYPVRRSNAEHDHERYTWRECDFRLGGVLVNVAHHGPGGKPTPAAIRLADAIKTEYRDEYREAPALVLRAHRHLAGDSGETIKHTRCIYAPALCLRESFAYRIAARPADVGGVLIFASNGRIEDIQIWTRTPPKRAPLELGNEETKQRRSGSARKGR